MKSLYSFIFKSVSLFWVLLDVCLTEEEKQWPWNVSIIITPDTRQPKTVTLLTIDERGSKIVRNSVFDCHLSLVG